MSQTSGRVRWCVRTLVRCMATWKLKSPQINFTRNRIRKVGVLHYKMVYEFFWYFHRQHLENLLLDVYHMCSLQEVLLVAGSLSYAFFAWGAPTCRSFIICILWMRFSYLMSLYHVCSLHEVLILAVSLSYVFFEWGSPTWCLSITCDLCMRFSYLPFLYHVYS
jgi:hypothetical protein